MNSNAAVTQNFFELFSLPVSFDIDRDQLQAKYLSLQTQFHPDRFASGSAQEQRIAIQFTAQLNEARLCLLDDVQRGRYLLKLNDQAMAEEETISDMEFLMQQMEWRESAQRVNSSESLESKTQFKQEMQVEFDRYYDVFSQALNSKDWQDAKLNLAKLQFMQKLLRTLK